MSGGFSEFLGELRRRKVFRVAITYAIVGWILIQVGEATFEPLQLPDWALTLLVVLLGLGFPVALVLAWAFESTPEGIKLDTGESNPQDNPEFDLRSIAVLPFVDMSPDKDQDYFCEGIAEEILNTLTRIANLRVASRTSSFQFKGKAMDMAEIGKRLKVGTVLEGSVRKYGDQLRVTAQLIQADNGYHLWSEKFDSQMEDLFTIQDHIADQIAEALEVALTPEGKESVHSGRTSDLAAYDFYLRGWKLFHAFGRKNFESARRMFQRAIDLDSGFARAWAGLADAAAFLCLYVEDTEPLRNEAVAASGKALELCDNIAEAHASRGLAHLICKEYDDAESCFDRAIEINPRLFEPYYFYARTSVHQGKYEQAAKYFEKAHEIDPADYQSALLIVQVYDELEQPEKADHGLAKGVVVARRQLNSNPDDIRAMYLTAAALARLGDEEQAFDLASQALTIDPNDTITTYNVACVFSRAGKLEEALDCLERVNLDAFAVGGWMQHDSTLKPLHGHPRFEALLTSLETKEDA
jgi:adenylate cyclase